MSEASTRSPGFDRCFNCDHILPPRQEVFGLIHRYERVTMRLLMTNALAFVALFITFLAVVR